MIMNKYYLKLTSFVALFAMCVAIMPANAANVTLTYSDPADGEIDSHTAGFYDVEVGWNTATDYAIGTDIRVTLAWSDTNVTGSSTALAACSGVTTAFTGNVTYSGQTADTLIITFTSAGTAGAGTICVSVPVADAGVLYEGNFSLAIITSNSDADYGAIEYYVGGGNDVLVDASVQPSLEFAIVETSDVGTETHACHIGTLTTASAETCDYRLRVSTNAASGFDISIEADDDLGAGHATITSVVAGTNIVGGTEAYGIAVTPAGSGGNDGTGVFTTPITVEAPFNGANYYPVPLSDTPFLSYTNSFIGTDAGSTTIVEHAAAIDGATVVGYYQQNVTYRVTPQF
jgi:hypothetical protein